MTSPYPLMYACCLDAHRQQKSGVIITPQHEAFGRLYDNRAFM
jgi:hypothetical protein